MKLGQWRNRQRDEIPTHAGSRIAFPQLPELGVRRSPTGVFTSQERDQTAPRIIWRRSQRGRGDGGKLVGRGGGNIRSRLSALLVHQARKLIADQVDADVVVVQCAEYLLDRFHPLDLPLTRFAELRSKQLEGVAQALG